MIDLLSSSIKVILEHQAPTGAYPAGPNFETYRHCWFRDGSFIAYAMDLAGESNSSAAFHAWAARAINSRSAIIERTISKKLAGKPVEPSETLHTRYALDGSDVADSDWPNHQLDGFGTWLWALNQHRLISKRPLAIEWERAAGLVAGYLAALWDSPCFDLWEEFPDQVHAYTLGAIHAGLRASSPWNASDRQRTLENIESYIRREATKNGQLVKYVGSSEVDSSLIGLAIPYRVVLPDSTLMRSTVARIEAELSAGGGLHRYGDDSYYGGGEWVVLTAWMGWYYAQAGERRKAEAALEWVEARADEDGYLPEQVPDSLIDPGAYGQWRQRWGEIAKPLLWSHAMHIILRLSLPDSREGQIR